MRSDFDWHSRGGRILMVMAAAGWLCTAVRASNLDTIGVTLLQSVVTNIDGRGIRVAQVEAEVTNNPPAFEVDPGAVGQPVSLFTYISSLGTSSTYPNPVGTVSPHANQVASYFYRIPGGVATNVLHVDNFDAEAFIQVGTIGSQFVAFLPSTNINDSVVNQSFILGLTPSQQQTVDSTYDDYAGTYDTLFVSGAGNGGQVYAPSTCYNGISVGVYGGPSSAGPTLDNGRAKPDITAPAGYSSFSTPQVAGAAAVLMQAALRRDGGNNTNAASDMRTAKALLLNGAVKPADWTNGPASPLDARYGAGVLNVFNSYEQLARGQHGYIVSLSVPTGAPHPPTGASGTVNSWSGWDFNTNSSTSTTDGVKHYYFNLTNGARFIATATLVWNRQVSQTDVNDLDLFLYDANSSNLVAASASPVDNVEQLFVRNLPPGRYDLQVLKNGGTGGKRVTNDETYALAFEFFSPTLNIAQSGTNAVITWPLYPAGFALESSSLQSGTNWGTNTPAPVATNNLNQVIVTTSYGKQFFRLRRP